MPNPPVRVRKRALPTSAANCDTRLHDDLRLVVEYLSPSELKLPSRKLRKHTKRNLAQIAASIAKTGFLEPMIIDDENRVVCGRGRLLVANEMGLSQVPVIRLSHLSSEQLRIFAIGSNRIAEQSEFDLAELRLELSELEGLNLDLDLELTGFSTSEIDDLLSGKSLEAADRDSEEVPQLEETAVTSLGNLWNLGQHRLICGNSLDEATYAALLGDEKAGMVFVDPPYNVKVSSISGMGKHKHREFAMAAGEMSTPQFTEFIGGYSRLLVQYSENGSIHFQCMDWKHMGEMLAGGEQAYAELKNLIVWAKPSAGMGSFYRSQHELIFVWKNGTAPHVNNFGLGDTGRYRSNVWSYKGNSGFHRDRDTDLAAHPTVKPWSLVADAIRDCSRRGAIILDVFGGSGTTLIAAERTRRKARLIELDPLYCDVTIRRWEKLTGQQAVLAATGQTFEEVAAERDVAPSEDLIDVSPDELDDLEDAA